jgi:hypothetical protein
MSGRDITGQRFGRLTAVHQTAKSSKKPRQNPRWLFRCDCGNETETTKTAVVNGHTQSCGCLYRETRKERLTHGHTQGRIWSPEYVAWTGMHDRCTREKRDSYKHYGGRGIIVCERWNTFENFLADMGPKPSPRHEIDRFPDNDGNYEPDNCRCATRIQQTNNTRANHLLTIDGQTMTVSEWAREANIHPGTLFDRVKRGWHPDWILMPFPGMTFWTG